MSCCKTLPPSIPGVPLLFMPWYPFPSYHACAEGAWGLGASPDQILAWPHLWRHRLSSHPYAGQETPQAGGPGRPRLRMLQLSVFHALLWWTVSRLLSRHWHRRSVGLAVWQGFWKSILMCGREARLHGMYTCCQSVPCHDTHDLRCGAGPK